jgi:hypothetical protein
MMEELLGKFIPTAGPALLIVAALIPLLLAVNELAQQAE